jgi:hypothetical protein
MPSNRLQRLTAIYLVVLYGVVGLTGGSLHYLVADLTDAWSTSDSVEVVTYYHVHAPDYHGHFHRHSNHVHHASAEIARNKPAHRSQRSAAATPERPIHQPHACPLLSLVSALKLVYASGCTPPIFLDLVGTQPLHADSLVATEVVADSLARGPPCALFA